jgi:hypothetical protein
MSKQILLLAQKAGLVSSEYNGFDRITLSKAEKKFAELIIKECLGVINTSCASPNAYFSIRKHFGVKE